MQEGRFFVVLLSALEIGVTSHAVQGSPIVSITYLNEKCFWLGDDFSYSSSSVVSCVQCVHLSSQVPVSGYVGYDAKGS